MCCLQRPLGEAGGAGNTHMDMVLCDARRPETLAVPEAHFWVSWGPGTPLVLVCTSISEQPDKIKGPRMSTTGLSPGEPTTGASCPGRIGPGRD